MTNTLPHTLEEIKADYHRMVSGVLHASPSEVLVFSHFGDFSQSKSDQVLRMVESSILELGDKRQMMKRVCSVLIEMLQNITLHAARDRQGHMHSYAIVSRGEGFYRLQTGNMIFLQDQATLHARLEELASLDKSALRKLYIETLCEDDFSSKGGAGLGLLTIFKRSVEAVEYELQSLEDGLGYFRLSAAIGME